MNRWVNSFQNHPFQKPWKDIVELSEKIALQDETVATDVQELARLKKVITYVGQLIGAADPELIPLSIWSSFQDQATQCADQINQYNSNKNITHLSNANSNLDNLLTYVRPYVVSAEGAAQAAMSAFIVYSDTINTQTDLIQSKTQASVNGTQANKEKSDEIYKEIEQSKHNIQQLEQKFLIGDSNEKSLQERMQILLGEAQEWNKIIGEFHKRLTSGNEQESAISLQIEEAKNKATKDKEAIESALQLSENLIKDLKEFYERVFGKEGSDGNVMVGLKQELDNRIKELDNFKINQGTAYNTLFQKIESLLPGATSTGLASAYRELRDSFAAPINIYTLVFCFTLAVMFFVGLWGVDFGDDVGLNKMLGSLYHKLPLLLPILWLAIFASRRRSESQRLQQEYAHKEALAKSFQSFKKQIDALQEKDEVLTKKLLDAMIGAVSHNASQTLDGKHGDKIPTQELLEGVIKKFPAQSFFEKLVDKILK
ncbi:MAG: hypothetical protein WDO70_00285 [Alphaproteobacteria bacterium]